MRRTMAGRRRRCDRGGALSIIGTRVGPAVLVCAAVAVLGTASCSLSDGDDLGSATLTVENLTDELYFPSSHSMHQVTVGAPLNARLSISGRF